MLAVQMRALPEGYEELRLVRVRPTVGHRKLTSCSVDELRVKLVSECAVLQF